MTGGWKFAAASVIGTSHLKNPDGLCQDSNLCRYDSDLELLICIVSDGAGSASRSQEGSQLACAFVADAVAGSVGARSQTREFALETLAKLQEVLLDEAQRHELRVREYACTLLVAIVGRENATFWQIGDGAICFRTASGEGLNYAFWPAKGEYANVTEFVTDANAAEELNFDTGELALHDVALFSDGLERLALDFTSGEVHEAFFAGLFPYLYRRSEGHLADLEVQMQSFLGSERVNARTDDDKTLLLASRVNDAA